ncbi:X-ray repair cross-complementing protein 5 [Halyomorpha halys]|uniref:X-ray repair cross-complementing protein 5 n=1 Tax=Halyomorpha halys TaxID=286706 RepID=UPI0006D52653|nr:X-ray repair cross-complementing protein 5-like [Halyomorpha halys]
MDAINVDSDDEQENNNPWEQAYSGKNGYVFLIDARKAMFHGSEKSYFSQSFECCLEAMLQIAREQRYDMVSFVLFGTSKSEGNFAPANVVLLRSLQTPSVSYISKIKEMIVGNFADVETYGQTTQVSLAKTINYCKSLLFHCKTRLYNKSIVLFTNDDDPCKGSDDGAHAARKMVEEICQHKIDLDIVGLGEFDSSKFYKELVLTAKGELLKNWEGVDPIKKIDDVQKEIGSISKKFNRHFGTFYLGGETKFKIMLYKLYHEPQKLMWTTKNAMTEKPKDEEKPINEDDIKIEEESVFVRDTQQENSERSSNNKPQKYPLIAGRFIPMTKAELKWFEPKVSKGLTLMGFRPISQLPAHLVEGEPCLVLPDTRDKASAELFAILHNACLQKNVAAFCWYALTKLGSPSPVILLPVESTEYAKGKKHPAGFHAIRIPFSDMINDCSENSGFSEIEPSESQMEAADGIIKKTTINWSPDTFNDAEYMTRIAMIEAIAMEYSEAPSISDNTDIDLTDIAEHLGDLNEKFIDCSHLPPEMLGKRGSNKEGREASTKEAKIIDSVSLISLIKAGKAEELTVAQLKELLKGEGVKSLSAMTKPRLVAIANKRFLSNN